MTKNETKKQTTIDQELDNEMSQQYPLENEHPTDQAEELVYEYYPVDDQLPELDEVDLTELVAFTDTPILDAKKYMRKINQNNVLSLRAARARGEELPRVKVTPTSFGDVLWDGYHRIEDLTQEALEALPANATDDDKRRATAGIRVKIERVAMANDEDLILHAQFANMSHGLPADSTGRSRLAIFMMINAAKKGETLNAFDAASLVGVTPPAIYRQIDRDLIALRKKEGYIQDIQVLETEKRALKADEAVRAETEQATSADNQDKAIMTFVKGILAVEKLLDDHTDEDSLREALETIAPKITSGHLEDMTQVLEVLSTAVQQYEEKTAKEAEVKERAQREKDAEKAAKAAKAEETRKANLIKMEQRLEKERERIAKASKASNV